MSIALVATVGNDVMMAVMYSDSGASDEWSTESGGLCTKRKAHVVFGWWGRRRRKKRNGFQLGAD